MSKDFGLLFEMLVAGSIDDARVLRRALAADKLPA